MSFDKNTINTIPLPTSIRVDCNWTVVPEKEWHNTEENTGILAQRDFSYNDIEELERSNCGLFVCDKKVSGQPYYILSCYEGSDNTKLIHILTPKQRQELSKKIHLVTTHIKYKVKVQLP